MYPRGTVKKKQERAIPIRIPCFVSFLFELIISIAWDDGWDGDRVLVGMVFDG